MTVTTNLPYPVRVRTPWPEQAAFLQRLDELKQKKKIRYDMDLADAAGISHTSISRWRSGQQRPSLDAVHSIAAALGVPAHTLAEAAGLVDPDRFGRAAPPTAEVEELAKIIQMIYETPGLTPEDQEHFIGRARADWEREQDTAEQRARDKTVTRIEEWKRARGA